MEAETKAVRDHAQALAAGKQQAGSHKEPLGGGWQWGSRGRGGEGSLHKTMHQSLEPQTRSLETGRPHPGLGQLSSGPQGDVRWEGQARAKGREKVGARPGQSLPHIPEEARVKHHFGTE